MTTKKSRAAAQEAEAEETEQEAAAEEASVPSLPVGAVVAYCLTAKDLHDRYPRSNSTEHVAGDLVPLIVSGAGHLSGSIKGHAILDGPRWITVWVPAALEGDAPSTWRQPSAG
jgi:hypothetical protein